MRLNQERHGRLIFDECKRSRHEACPVSRREKVFKNDRQLGRTFTGKYENVYCECPCHATHPISKPGDSK